MVVAEAAPPGLHQLQRGPLLHPLSNHLEAHLQAPQHTRQRPLSKLGHQLSKVEALASSVRWLLQLRKYISNFNEPIYGYHHLGPVNNTYPVEQSR